MKKLSKFPNTFFIIAGPCVIEGEDFTLKIADKLKCISDSLSIPIIFKSSFDKANRSSIDGFRGIGMEDGLKILAKVRSKIGLAILSDVHTPKMVPICHEILDIIQIPAFLARQTDFYIEAGKLSSLVNVKKGQFMDPKEMKNVITKFKSVGGSEISITERGTFFGYGNLVVDFRSIKVIKNLGVPYVYDATHSLQLPATSSNGTASGGEREYTESLALAQIAAGANALFIETHPNPDQAKSDSATQYPLGKMEKLILKLKRQFDFTNQIN